MDIFTCPYAIFILEEAFKNEHKFGRFRVKFMWRNKFLFV
jgi:hypothetical protein